MSCTVDRRATIYSARDALDGTPCVVGMDVLPPGADPTGDWTLEATVDTDGVPAVVSGIVAEYGLTIRAVRPQGPMFRLVATA